MSIDIPKSLHYFVGRIVTIHTRPTNWKHSQEQSLDYFMGLVDSVEPLGIMLTNVLNRKKTFLFLDSIIGIAEETIVDPEDQEQMKAILDYEEKKKKILQDNPSLVTPKTSRPMAPPPPPQPPSSGGCGGGCGDSFVNIKSISQISQAAREKLAKP